jgi:hypothetical protein
LIISFLIFSKDWFATLDGANNKRFNGKLKKSEKVSSEPVLHSVKIFVKIRNKAAFFLNL